jgi:hypothetical protein
MPIAPLREFLADAFNQRFGVEAFNSMGKHNESSSNREQLGKTGDFHDGSDKSRKKPSR